MPALQWIAHHRVGAASVDLKREKANLSNNRCTGIDATCTCAAQAGEVIRANLSSTKRRIAEDRLSRSRGGPFLCRFLRCADFSGQQQHPGKFRRKHFSGRKVRKAPAKIIVPIVTER